MRKLARVFFVSKVSTGVNTTATRCGTPPRWSLLSWTCELRWDFFPPSCSLDFFARACTRARTYVDRETREDEELCESANRLSVKPAKVVANLTSRGQVCCSGWRFTCRRYHAVCDVILVADAQNVPWSRYSDMQ